MAKSRRTAVGHDPQPEEQPEGPASEPLVEITHIEGDLPGNFVLGEPVRVEVWIENGEYVADAPDVNLHAFGATREEALVNIRAMIVEQHQRVGALRGRLSPPMRQEAERLTAIVLPRHA